MPWFLSLIGVGSLILGTGLSTATPSDWTVPQRVAIAIIYWVIRMCCCIYLLTYLLSLPFLLLTPGEPLCLHKGRQMGDQVQCLHVYAHQIL